MRRNNRKKSRQASQTRLPKWGAPGYVPVPAPCRDVDDCHCGSTEHSAGLRMAAVARLKNMLSVVADFELGLGSTPDGNLMVIATARASTDTEARRTCAGVAKVLNGSKPGQNECRIEPDNAIAASWSTCGVAEFHDPTAPGMPPWAFMYIVDVLGPAREVAGVQCGTSRANYARSPRSRNAMAE